MKRINGQYKEENALSGLMSALYHIPPSPINTNSLKVLSHVHAFLLCFMTHWLNQRCLCDHESETVQLLHGVYQWVHNGRQWVPLLQKLLAFTGSSGTREQGSTLRIHDLLLGSLALCKPRVAAISSFLQWLCHVQKMVFHISSPHFLAIIFCFPLA